MIAGFTHKDNQQSIDLNSVRLCFQVFLEGTEKGAFTFALRPVVSDPIYDKSKKLSNYNNIQIVELNSVNKISNYVSITIFREQE